MNEDIQEHPPKAEPWGCPPRQKRNDTGLPSPGRRPSPVMIAIILAALLLWAGLFAGGVWLAHRLGVSLPTPAPHWEQEEPPAEESETPAVTPDGEEESGQCYLEQAELGGSLRLETHSQEGLSPLSYEEIYAQNINAVVSLRCVWQDGSGCTGTGIVLSEDGYLVTNEHVVENAQTCTVTLWDDTEYEAKLVGMDEETDLAVLKIDAEGLTPAQFGETGEMVVGNPCAAIGNPLGEKFRGTMTTGIVSALNRNVSVNGHYMMLIQTDCAINSGNSGGPLINGYGQVIGICNMKMMSTSTTVEGLGFAIPTDTVKTIVNKLIEHGEVVRAMLGITAYDLPAEQCRELGIDGGVCVATVSEQSGAYGTVAEGDVIIAADGIPISTVNQLNTYKADMAPGDVITLTVLRDGTTFDTQITLKAQSDISP